MAQATYRISRFTEAGELVKDTEDDGRKLWDRVWGRGEEDDQPELNQWITQFHDIYADRLHKPSSKADEQYQPAELSTELAARIDEMSDSSNGELKVRQILFSTNPTHVLPTGS